MAMAVKDRRRVSGGSVTDHGRVDDGPRAGRPAPGQRPVETSPSPPSETTCPRTGDVAPSLVLLPRHGPQSGEEPHRFGAPTSESGPVLWGP